MAQIDTRSFDEVIGREIRRNIINIRLCFSVLIALGLTAVLLGLYAPDRIYAWTGGAGIVIAIASAIGLIRSVRRFCATIFVLALFLISGLAAFIAGIFGAWDLWDLEEWNHTSAILGAVIFVGTLIGGLWVFRDELFINTDEDEPWEKGQ